MACEHQLDVFYHVATIMDHTNKHHCDKHEQNPKRAQQ